jgi:hypothetical protein
MKRPELGEPAGTGDHCQPYRLHFGSKDVRGLMKRILPVEFCSGWFATPNNIGVISGD